MVSDGDVFGKPTQRLINSASRAGANKYLSMKPSSNFLDQSTNSKAVGIGHTMERGCR